jgi:hypothetical protein
LYQEIRDLCAGVAKVFSKSIIAVLTGTEEGVMVKNKTSKLKELKEAEDKSKNLHNMKKEDRF